MFECPRGSLADPPLLGGAPLAGEAASESDAIESGAILHAWAECLLKRKGAGPPLGSGLTNSSNYAYSDEIRCRPSGELLHHSILCLQRRIGSDGEPSGD